MEWRTIICLQNCCLAIENRKEPTFGLKETELKEKSRAEIGGSVGCGVEDNNLSSKLKRQKCGFEIENKTN